VKHAASGTPAFYSAQRKLRLAYFVTHPIQYQAPLLRRIAAEPDIDLKVFFSSDLSVRGHVDKEFGVRVQWDTPLLDGYNYEFLPTLRDARDGKIPGFARPLNYRIKKKLRDGNFDAIWVHGYNYLTNLQAIRAAHSMSIPVLLRAESTLHDRPRSLVKLAIKRLFFDLLKTRVSAVLSIGDENTAYWKYYFGESFPIFPVLRRGLRRENSCCPSTECRLWLQLRGWRRSLPGGCGKGAPRSPSGRSSFLPWAWRRAFRCLWSQPSAFHGDGRRALS